MDIGSATGRGSINREGRSIQQTLYLRLGSSPGKQDGELPLFCHFTGLYVALYLASLHDETICQWLLRALGSGFGSRGEIDRQSTVGIRGSGAHMILSIRKS